VFSRLAVLELNLPNAQSQVVDQPPEPELQLEITIRENSIEVGDRNEGRLQLFENSAESYDLAALSEYLQNVKRTFPDKADATVLLEPDIAYQVIVEVMDTVRVVQLVDEASSEVVRYELFPEISIGDAPIPN
jgi:biopolymer transport protein ExbD